MSDDNNNSSSYDLLDPSGEMSGKVELFVGGLTGTSIIIILLVVSMLNYYYFISCKFIHYLFVYFN
jgi:hypothetical protein